MIGNRRNKNIQRRTSPNKTRAVILVKLILLLFGSTIYAKDRKSYNNPLDQNPTSQDEVPMPIYPIAEVESYQGNIIKTGLANLLCPNTALTARHIVSQANKTKISFGDQTRTVSFFRELRDLENKDLNADALANDIIIIGWDLPLTIKDRESTFPTLATSPPKKDKLIFIPKLRGAEIIWETRHISGLDSHCSWVGLPKPIYKGILWLNGEKINEGTPFNIGDSGGGWITGDGTVVAITSRVDNTSFSPHSQTAYGANVFVDRNYNPNSDKEKNTIAYRPMVAATILLVLVWAVNQIRRLYTKRE